MSAGFISGQLRLLSDCLVDAREALKGEEDVILTERGAERNAAREIQGEETDGEVSEASPRRPLKKWFEEDGDCDPEVCCFNLVSRNIVLLSNEYTS